MQQECVHSVGGVQCCAGSGQCVHSVGGVQCCAGSRSVCIQLVQCCAGSGQTAYSVLAAGSVCIQLMECCAGSEQQGVYCDVQLAQQAVGSSQQAMYYVVQPAEQAVGSRRWALQELTVASSQQPANGGLCRWCPSTWPSAIPKLECLASNALVGVSVSTSSLVMIIRGSCRSLPCCADAWR